MTIEELLDRYTDRVPLPSGFDDDGYGPGGKYYSSDGEGGDGWWSRRPRALTLAEAQDFLAAIRGFSNDDAHRAQDWLWAGVLQAIAESTADARALAKLALEARNIPFERWYA